MRIERFEVEGFRNLNGPVVFEPGPGPVFLYGANNVGKTNLMEAIELFFGLLSVARRPTQSLPLDNSYQVDLASTDADPILRLLSWETNSGDVFTLPVPSLVRMCATLLVPEADETALDLGDLIAQSPDAGDRLVRVELEQELRPAVHPGAPLHRVKSIRAWRGPVPSTKKDVWTPEFGFDRQPQVIANRIGKWIAGGVGAPRVRLSGGPNRGEESSYRSALPNAVLLRAYNAVSARDRARRAAWATLSQNFQAYFPQFRVTQLHLDFEVASSRAVLSVDNGVAIIPSHLMGDGPQALLRTLLAVIGADAPIVILEEPETALALPLQKQLGALLRALYQNSQGLPQLFIVTHSPWICAAERAIGMFAGEKGPELREIGGAQIDLITAREALDLRPNRGDLGWLDADGTLQLPEGARAALSLPNGGPVGFVTHPERQTVELTPLERLAEQVFGDTPTEHAAK